MDVADIAQVEQERELDRALLNHHGKKTIEESASDCVECGNEIPPARQVAVPGVQTCVGCQELIERKAV